MGRITEVLPYLQNVLFEGSLPTEPDQEVIAEIISARQLANHPVAVSVWDRRMMWNESYEVHDRSRSCPSFGP